MTLDATFTLGSTSEGVTVNSWTGVVDNLVTNYLTTVNDCTPVSSSSFGTLPDGKNKNCIRYTRLCSFCRSFKILNYP